MHETRSRSLSRPETKRKREDSEGNVRSSSKVPRDKSGVRDVTMAKEARKINKLGQRKRNLGARIGEADRRIFVKKPKHLCKLGMFYMINRFFISFLLQFPANDQVAKQIDDSLCFVLFIVMFFGINKEKKKTFYERKKELLFSYDKFF